MNQSTMELCSKQMKKVENDSADNMSTLPDSVLCHILSFLPTRTSVATMSLVSRRWRYLWKHLQVFDFFVDSKCYCEQPNFFRSFAFYVNSVLSLRKSRDIRKLNLNCDGVSDNDTFPGDCIDMWLRAAIGPYLQELSILVYNCCRDQILNLPSSLFDCTNLVSLSLDGAISIKVKNSSVRFPSLKMLKLWYHDVVDSEVVGFLSGCPVLETLDIDHFSSSSAITPVPPPSKRLKFTCGNFSWTYLEIGPSYCATTNYPDIILGIIGNLQSAVEAYLDIFFLHQSEFGDPIVDKFRNDHLNIYLLLCHSKSKWPLHAPVLNCPEFHNLHHLKFILPCFNSNLLVSVLEKCHMLQVLVIQSCKEEPLPLRTWEPQSTTVPKCLKSHLNYIHIEGYQGFEDELTFAEYILRNGLVLKTMLIFVDISMDIKNRYLSLKRLTDIPKGSVTCQLKFDVAVSP